MLLGDLIADLEVLAVHGSLQVNIESLCYDSRSIAGADSLFVAVTGENTDGNLFVGEAIKVGAPFVTDRVTQKVITAASDARSTVVVVKEARPALATLAAKFFGHPTNQLKIAGVTGTNGKTTTTFLIKHICQSVGITCGLIGTIQYELGDGTIIKSERTTPEAPVLQSLFAKMLECKTEAAVIEISSHALAQKRTNGIELDAAIFTNLTPDHLDFHGTISDYFSAKSKLFLSHLPHQVRKRGWAIINLDDAYGQKLLKLIPKDMRVLGYGKHECADLLLQDILLGVKGSSFQLTYSKRRYHVNLPLIGEFNVYNAVAAIAGAMAFGIDLNEALDALATVRGVLGRLQHAGEIHGVHVFVDYAHTEDALQNALLTLRNLAPSHLIVVFGCGGNRDKSKRPRMGRIAEQYSDYSIVTSDNPRQEDPQVIAQEIRAGMASDSSITILDRRAAILHALKLARPGDILLVAGKGHERYQEFANETVEFDDVAVIEALSSEITAD